MRQTVLEEIRRTYFSPADDCQTALLNFVQTARHMIRVCDFTFNLVPLADLLIAKYQAGVDVRLVLDRTEAGIPSEKPLVTQLRAAGVPLVAGTSERHRIMHMKYLVVDDVWVLSGSFNFSATAELEANFIDIENNALRAQAFLDDWQRLWDWISRNEPVKEAP